jgi:hypothetical protein
MAYKLLGMVVWRAGRWYLRRRYGGRGRGRFGLAAGAAGAAALAAVLAARRKRA